MANEVQQLDFTAFMSPNNFGTNGEQDLYSAGLDFVQRDPLSYSNVKYDPEYLLPELQVRANQMANRAAVINRNQTLDWCTTSLSPNSSTDDDDDFPPPTKRTRTSPTLPCSPALQAKCAESKHSCPKSSPGLTTCDAGAAIKISASSASAKSTSPATEKPATDSRPVKHWSGVPRRRMPHHVVERRYRDNLNERIDTLRLAVPSLAEHHTSASDVEEAVSTKLPSKASVIAAALEYIHQLQEETARLSGDAAALREQVSGLQKLVRCEDCSVIKYFNELQLGSDPVPVT